MSVHVDKNGNLIITVPKEDYFHPAEELRNRRKAVIELIAERSESFSHNDPVYFALQIIQDTEPNFEQWKAALQVPPE